MIYSLAFLLLTHFLAYFLAFLFLTTTTTFLLTTFILTYFHSRSRLARNGQPTNQAALNSIVMIVGCPLCCSSLQHLNSLLENYLEPLKKETFLSSAEISALFGNIQEIVAFQRLFLDSLEQALALEPNFDYLEQPFQFKVLACHLVAVSLGDDEIIFFLSAEYFVRRGQRLPVPRQQLQTVQFVLCQPFQSSKGSSTQ